MSDLTRGVGQDTDPKELNKDLIEQELGQLVKEVDPEFKVGSQEFGDGHQFVVYKGGGDKRREAMVTSCLWIEGIGFTLSHYKGAPEHIEDFEESKEKFVQALRDEQEARQ